MVRSVSTTQEFEAEINHKSNRDKLIVVDFFATWCGACARIAPKTEEWSTGEFKDSVTFLKCDVDQAEEISERYHVEAMPTFVFFKNGSEIYRLVGTNADQLKNDIEQWKFKIANARLSLDR